MKKFFGAIWKFGLLILSVIFLWLVFFIYRPFEPHYQWKPLSAWLAILCEGRLDAKPDNYQIERQKRAAEAIQNIGASAIPQLLKLIEGEGKSADKGLSGLILIGADAIPPLIDVLTNQNAKGRVRAVLALEILGDHHRNFALQIRPAIPVLIQCLNDKNIFVRQISAEALGRIQQEPSLVVPALVEVIKSEINNPSPDSWFLVGACIHTLGSFQTNAQPAVPLLIEIMKTSHSGKATLALSGLRQIAPEIGEAYYQKLVFAKTNPPPDDSVSNVFYNYYGEGDSFAGPNGNRATPQP